MGSIFGLDKVSYHDKGLALLTTVYSPFQRVIIESMLRDAEIPYISKERGSGAAVTVIAGYAITGTDIFVRENHLEEAQALIAPVEAEANEEETADEDETENA